jgi:hypothetical protein
MLRGGPAGLAGPGPRRPSPEAGRRLIPGVGGRTS